MTNLTLTFWNKQKMDLKKIVYVLARMLRPILRLKKKNGSKSITIATQKFSLGIVESLEQLLKID